MPRGSHMLGTPMDEEKWSRAKERAAEEGHAEDWPYVVAIYKKMSHSGEFQHKFIKERKKKKQTLPEWKKKTKDWKKKRVLVKKSSVDKPEEIEYSESNLRLILSKSSLDEFRCGECRALLFKGHHLQKSFIEVKCRSCGTFNINKALQVD